MFVADILLKPTEEDGRKKPLIDSWRGILRTPQGNFDGILAFPGKVYPGGKVAAEIKLLSPELAKEQFPIGALFELWEGKTIGFGRVTKHDV